MIRSYRFGPRSRARLAQQMLVLIIPLAVLGVTAYLIQLDRITLQHLLVAMLFGSVMLLLFLAQIKKRIDLVMQVYEVRLYRDSISVISPVAQGNVEVELDRDEISGIVEHQGRGIQLLTSDPKRQIYLFEDLEDFDQLRSVLVGWGKVETRPASFWVRHGMLVLMMAMAALMAAAMLATDPRFAIPGSIIVIGILGWAFPKLPPKLRIALVFPVVALSYKVWLLTFRQ